MANILPISCCQWLATLAVDIQTWEMHTRGNRCDKNLFYTQLKSPFLKRSHIFIINPFGTRYSMLQSELVLKVAVYYHSKQKWLEKEFKRQSTLLSSIYVVYNKLNICVSFRYILSTMACKLANHDLNIVFSFGFLWQGAFACYYIADKFGLCFGLHLSFDMSYKKCF